jgi:mannose-6-phosphate isomerase-like protein (cupin superfamily)
MLTHIDDHIRVTAERWYKGTIFQSAHMLVGVDCLAPGQSQSAHMHRGHDKMYFVQSGSGEFTIGTTVAVCTTGSVIIAPADTVHSVSNIGTEPLILLIAMAPEPK